MANFKIMCPKCFATILTDHPETLIWELCPACRRHVWEAYDLMMAEAVISGKQKDRLVERNRIIA